MLNKLFIIFAVMIGATFLLPAIGFSNNFHWNQSTHSRWDLSTIESPKRLQVLTKEPVEIIVIFHEGAKPETFKAWLNHKNITDKFEPIDNGMKALIDSEDGLRIDDNTEKNSISIQGLNYLRTSVKGKRWLKDTDFRLFLVKIEKDPADIDDDKDGYTENQGDCDDSDDTIYPWAEEICDDGIDQNCDGSDCSEYDGTFVGEATSDYCGTSHKIRSTISDYRIEVIIIDDFTGTVHNMSGFVNPDGSTVVEVDMYGYSFTMKGQYTGDNASGTWDISEYFPDCFGTWYTTRIEGFETGDLSRYPWMTSGDGEWVVTDTAPFDGNFSAQSPILGDNNSASLEIKRDCDEGTVSFRRKVSSEFGYDYLAFYIDDKLKDAWSGSVPYTQSGCSSYTSSSCTGYTTQSGCIGYTQSGCISYTVSAGTHNFKWEFIKDSSISKGQDAAWIDNVLLP